MLLILMKESFMRMNIKDWRAVWIDWEKEVMGKAKIIFEISQIISSNM